MDSTYIVPSMVHGVSVALVKIQTLRDAQAHGLQARLRELALTSGGRVAVGMHDVTDLTSACINALVATSQQCASQGGRLVLFGVSRDLRHVFQSTGLTKYLALADEMDDAVRAVKRGRPWLLRLLSDAA